MEEEPGLAWPYQGKGTAGDPWTSPSCEEIPLWEMVGLRPAVQWNAEKEAAPERHLDVRVARIAEFGPCSVVGWGSQLGYREEAASQATFLGSPGSS